MKPTEPMWFELPPSINEPEFIVCRRLRPQFEPGTGLAMCRDTWETDPEVDAHGVLWSAYRAVRGSERYYLNRERVDRETWEAKYWDYEQTARDQSEAPAADPC